jgi:hypothetical protein
VRKVSDAEERNRSRKKNTFYSGHLSCFCRCTHLPQTTYPQTTNYIYLKSLGIFIIFIIESIRKNLIFWKHKPFSTTIEQSPKYQSWPTKPSSSPALTSPPASTFSPMSPILFSMQHSASHVEGPTQTANKKARGSVILFFGRQLSTLSLVMFNYLFHYKAITSRILFKLRKRAWTRPHNAVTQVPTSDTWEFNISTLGSPAVCMSWKVSRS